MIEDCDHIWIEYAEGEQGDTTLSAPEGTATFTEPVRICAVCALIEPLEGAQ